MYDEPRRPADQALGNEDRRAHDPPVESGPRHGFWSGLADILLSIPAGVGIRIGG